MELRDHFVTFKASPVLPIRMLRLRGTSSIIHLDPLGTPWTPRAAMPSAYGMPVSLYVGQTLGHPLLFVEDMVAHAVQVNLPRTVALGEIPESRRDPQNARRFALGLLIQLPGATTTEWWFIAGAISWQLTYDPDGYP